MRFSPRRIGFICLIALLLNASILFAQENNTAVGSGIIAPIVQAAAETSGTDVTVSVTGTDRGLAAFCQGEADLALATRPLSETDGLNCSASGVNFLELLAGYNAIALVSSPDATFNQCLTSDQLRSLLAPSAQGQVTDWSQVNAENPSSPITIVAPPDTVPAYAALDSLVEGVGIRSDVQIAQTDEAAISQVSSNSNALGIVSYASAAQAGEALRILQLNTSAAGCTAPSLETIEGREYAGAERLFVYVNSTSLSKPGLTDLLNSAFSEDAAGIVSSLGFVAPSANTYAIDQQVIAETQTGRQFTRDVDAFTIPSGLAGTVNLGGSPSDGDYIQTVTTAFTTAQPGVTLNQSYLGEPDGFRRLCNGELDITVAFSDLSSEQADNCSANNVEPFPVDLGRQAVVLVANAASDYLTCLTTDQLNTLWNASSAGTITTWNQISAEFPDTAFTLFAPQPGNVYTDILMTALTGSAAPTRIDTQLDDDAAYRAAATANVEGALTYMSWPEYQTIQQSGQENVALLGVDSGSGCVQPSEATIGDGSYALSRALRLIVNRSTLARPEVQSLLWFIASDENYTSISSSGLVGLSFGDLADLRFTLQETFAQVTAELAQVAPESTAEATMEAEAATPEATAAAG
jgi:phosphate transport system substrate-binding protein